MALLWIDGFDHYTASHGTDFSLVHGGAYDLVQKTQIRTMPVLGGYGIRSSIIGTGNVSEWLRKTLDTSRTSGLLGVGTHFYVYNSQLDSVSNNYGIISFLSSNGAYRFHVGASWGTDNFTATALKIYAGTSTTPIATSENTLNPDTLYHIEVQIFQHATEGWIAARVDGVEWVRIEDIDTTASIGAVSLLTNISGTNTWNQGNYYDNFYIYDDTGSANNDWLGDRLVYTLMPTGDGVEEDWTPSSGSDGYAMVDEIPADGDTTTITSNNTGDVSQFSLPSSIPSGAEVLGVQVAVSAKRTGTEIPTIAIGPEGDPSDPLMVPTSYAYLYHISEINPDTSLPWTDTEVNAMLVELERVT